MEKKQEVALEDFNSVYEYIRKNVYKLTGGKDIDIHSPEDITQDCVEKYLKDKQKGVEVKNAASYLYTICRNHIFNKKRNFNNRAKFEDQELDVDKHLEEKQGGVLWKLEVRN